ncbi:MAG: metal-sensing transcriptional repressor [Patescibacteria group bacterium]
MKQEDKKLAAARSLKKAQGTLVTVLGMVEDSGSDCLSTVQQIDSVIGLLRSARRSVVTGRMEECFGKELKGDKKVTAEMLNLYNRIA